MPGGRGRGSLGRLLGGQGEGRDPRRRRRARGRDGGLPRRPVHDRGRRRRDAHRGSDSAAAGRRQRAREGRAPRRRLGDRRRVGGRLDRRRQDRRRGHRAQRGRAHDDPSLASRGAAARQGSVGGAVRAGGRDRLGGLLADARTVAGRSTTSAISPASSRHAPCAARRHAPCIRRPDHARLDIDQRRAGLPRDRAASAARPLHSRDARPDRHPLGLRHLQLRRLRRADGRRAGQVVHDPGGDVRGPRDPHGRVARGRRPAGSGPDGLPRAARPPVRLLHAGDADDGARAARREPGSDRPGDPHGDLGCASAAARATRTSSAPCAGPPSTKPPRNRRSRAWPRSRTFRAPRPSARSASVG